MLQLLQKRGARSFGQLNTILKQKCRQDLSRIQLIVGAATKQDSANTEQQGTTRIDVRSFIHSAVFRATRVMSSSSSSPSSRTKEGTQEFVEPPNAAVGSLLSTTLSRVEKTLFATTTNDYDSVTTTNPGVDASVGLYPPFQPPLYEFDFDKVASLPPRPSNTDELYSRNPAVTMTALAHSQWSFVVRPGVDTVIDATCGNGKDALVLAELLFSSQRKERKRIYDHDDDDDDDDREQIDIDERSTATRRSKLICVDIDSKACAATQERLQTSFLRPIEMGRIQVINASHDPLPLECMDEDDMNSIGLIVYNLGWLPQSPRKDSVPTTETEPLSTLKSIAQAAQLVRIGGMLSVMTYPGSNAVEDAVIRAFVTGLALYSSKTVDWQRFTYLDDPNVDSQSIWNQRIMDCLHQVRDHYGGPSSSCPITFRVHEHRKLGWSDAPTLLTATRVK